jgi:hypothetical protein
MSFTPEAGTPLAAYYAETQPRAGTVLSRRSLGTLDAVTIGRYAMTIGAADPSHYDAAAAAHRDGGRHRKQAGNKTVDLVLGGTNEGIHATGIIGNEVQLEGLPVRELAEDWRYGGTLIDDVASAAKRVGWADSHVHSERFTVPPVGALPASGSVVGGTLNSTPNTAFHIEFFASNTADPSGFGEGQTFLGFTNVTTDAAGDAAFTTSMFGLSENAETAAKSRSASNGRLR